MHLSRRAKEAIKTGLAMAMVYAIALQLAWMNPYWAGFAVAMISLPTAGQSLNKGANRMFGTFLGCAAALTLLGLFPQERWWFMAGVSVYIAVCTWKMTGSRHQYFWQVAGFVCLIICLSGPVSETAFEDAVARTLETGLGIGCYTLVAVFLWPVTSVGSLNDVSLKLLATQKELYGIYRRRMARGDTEADYESVRSREIQLLAQLEQVLNAAGSESYEVSEVRHLWDRLEHESTALMETLEQWREGFAELHQLDVGKVLPDLDAFHAELDLRFAAIERVLGGNPSQHEPRTVSLTVARSTLKSLTHFQQAAVAVTRSQLERLEALSRSLFDCSAELKGFRPAVTSLQPRVERRAAPVFDLDRFEGVVMVLVTLWVSFLLWVYVDPPGHSALVQLAPTVAFALARTRQLRGSALLMPFAVGLVFAGVFYVLIMPHLSGYAQLGPMIFVAWFLINYIFWQPRQAIARLACSISFVSMVKIENEQTYSFASYANSAAFVLIGVSLVAACSYLPVSPRPEKAFLRLVFRFFRSCEFLMSRMAYGPAGERPRQTGPRAAYYRHELATLPQKLWAWTRVLDFRALPDTKPDQVRSLMTNLHALAFRVKELVEAMESPQAEFLVRELVEDVRVLRLEVQALFHSWSQSVATESVSELQVRLSTRLARLEARIEETLSRDDEEELTLEHRENFYRLLGSYRGVAEAAVSYAGFARDVNWAPWREARF